MPRCLVKQNNGKWAVWSSVVDHFIAYDCTLDEAIAESTGPMQAAGYPGGKEGLLRDVLKEVEHIETNGRAWGWSPTWDEAIKLKREFHGDDDETLAEILQHAH